MSSALRLPEELRLFLQLPGPQTLLVRGPPGSGKSTLCSAMLEAAAGTRLLITNRVSTGELEREFPWLGKNGGSQIQVVDTSEMDGSLLGITHEATNAALIADSDSQERRILTEFLRLPPPIQDAWSRIPSDGPSLVVVDSWDALVEHYLGRRAQLAGSSLDRAEIERMLLRQMGRSPSHLVMVLETDQPTQLDYLVNGVVVTRRDVVNDRLERWLQLPKLRGIRIANSSYPYTVEGAKFQCIEPLRAYTEIRRGRPDPEPDMMPGFIWPGSRSFAEAFGRLGIGRMTFIELAEDVPDHVVQHLLTPMKSHALQRGGRVLVVPSPGLTVDEIWAPMEEELAPGHLAEHFRVLDVTGQLERATRPGGKTRQASLISLKALSPTTPGADPDENEISRWLRGGVAGGHPSLVTMYGSGLEALASTLKIPITSEMAATIPAAIQNTLSNGNMHMIAVSRGDTPLLRTAKSLASIHLRMVNRQGRVLVYGFKPWTTGFVIVESPKAGPYELLRIV